MEQKTFYQALIDINTDPSRTKKCLQDKRLTNIEKRIIESFLLIRNNENKEAVSLMRSLPFSELPFVEAMKDLLIGLSLNNQSYFIEAEKSILKAIPALKKLNCDYFLFISYFNLSFIYMNTSQLDKTKESIRAMEDLHPQTDLQKLRILRCKFAYFSEADEDDCAAECLAEIDKFRNLMPESDAISQLICEFGFHIGQENFAKCEEVLKSMKNFRKFNLTENFKFIKKLLSHLTHNNPVYAYDKEFDSIPILMHQIYVIKHLEEQNIGDAKIHWSKLQEIAPDMFSADFIFKGKKCLFSLCLEKHIEKRSSLKIEKSPGYSQLDTLISLLINSEKPLSKGLIYELLWDDPPTDKDDLKKLARLVHRARTERGIEIISRKGTYFVETKSVKLKVS